MQKKSFNTPDEVMTPQKAKIEIVTVGSATVSRNTFEPGWKWSEHIKPTAGTDLCQVHHVICALSGNLKVVMEDGTELDVAAGDVIDIPAGHDAWVIGDEPMVGIDIGGLNKSV